VPAAIAHPVPADLVVVAGVGVLGIAVPYALELTALRRVGVATYSILLSLDPAIAGLVGLLLLGQQLDPVVVVGIGLVIAASAGAVATR
jgi:inner membrane transporter RhtA